jgi:hypothetical protein
MKIKDVISEVESPSKKLARHSKDLDDLEREIRKSGSMDDETKDAIDKRRMKMVSDKLRQKK